MPQITLDTLVSEIVAELPQTTDLFRHKRIDYYCDGKASLKEAATKRGYDPEKILFEIKDVETRKKNYHGLKPKAFDTITLINYIQMKHHRYLKEELVGLSSIVKKVAMVHGEKQTELRKVKQLFDRLRIELLNMMNKEDQYIFPILETYQTEPSEKLRKKVDAYLFELESKHDLTGGLLHELREITNDFQPPADACNTFQLVYKRLNELEKDTCDHIHIENHVLFKKVRQSGDLL
ncbi:iron-sulfur cluster repair di-iron protein [Gracilibacillus dipsosauri]|uniref:Iron-sulfur cluster repair di-iron protein n=1 Tax=Gracilibacillus dipsosauri TaxID=178340 RepID=A0A317L377_9BACI|nr:iron-sulfur cluster repair di-iron protein [Gracilibacillus dipsosauri]PWU70342.1 iron-sulfur cluster repair di-iron protein [Gracilibacillus dipsosauri]